VDVIVYWDSPKDPRGNVQHIAAHGLDPAEVEAVLMDTTSRTERSRRHGDPITFGWTPSGVFIAVVWKELRDNPRVIRPITAYPVEP
jgi:uncharacterized DUF497 family protein